MQMKRWSRIDQTLLEGLLWALPGVVLLALVVRVARAVRGDPLEVTGPLPDALTRPAEAVSGPLSGTVVVGDPTVADHLFALLPLAAGLALAVTAAWLLLGIARGLRSGDPFTVGNARRLTTLAVLVVVGGLALPLADSVSREVLLAAALPDVVRPSVHEFSLWPFPLGMLVFFLAEVFARGVRLRQDVEGLV